MTQQSDASEAQPLPPALKIVEPDVDPDEPWRDDMLGREEIADRLTSIIRGQEAPFVISVDGRWGTGKTFLLKRWRQALQNEGFQAIYFNAWEDDFCDDPLLAIIGQLTEHFHEKKLRAMAALIGEIALPILTAKLTGVAFRRTDLRRDNLLNDYKAQLRTKDQIRTHLTRLAAEVNEQSGQPLVFIIDELDRCRPTFAIELLERVKHIFDVPNIVFVFGINRSELTKSLRSVYGEIDAGEYLRRFFDMEFVLPDADPGQFCTHLVAKFRLSPFFSEVDRRRQNPYYMKELGEIDRLLPVVLGRMGLSLRDMDYCVRLVALAARESLANQRLYPPLLVLLAATKLRAPELYRRFVQGDARGADLINHLNEQRPLGDPTAHIGSDPRSTLNWLEAATYYADDPNRSLGQLKRLEDGAELDQPEYVSAELAGLDLESEENLRRLRHIIQTMQGSWTRFEGYQVARRSIAEKIDIYADFVRR